MNVGIGIVVGCGKALHRDAMENREIRVLMMVNRSRPVRTLPTHEHGYEAADKHTMRTISRT